MQDYIFEEYLIKAKRKPIIAYLEGNGDLHSAMLACTKEWASVRVRANETLGNCQAPAGDESYYDDDGLNRACITANESQMLCANQGPATYGRQPVKTHIIALLLLGSVSATQEAHAQTFEEFAVREVYSGRHAKAPPDASRKHKAALSRPVNFSGHYIVYFYPCGGGCITGSVIDVKEGDIVAALPDVYVIDSFKSTFRPTSTLMVITGQSAQEGGAVKTVFYNFVEDEFRPLKTEQQ